MYTSQRMKQENERIKIRPFHVKNYNTKIYNIYIYLLICYRGANLY